MSPMVLKLSSWFCPIVLLAALCVPLAGTAQGIPAQSASVSDVRAKISIDHESTHGGVVIVVTFTSDTPETAHLKCLSGYLDLQYVLRDAAGKVIPIDPDAWKTPDQTNYYNNGPCSLSPLRRHGSRVLLSALYPGLAPGTYTLQIALAPRGRAGRAIFQPIQLDVH